MWQLRGILTRRNALFNGWHNLLRKLNVVGKFVSLINRLRAKLQLDKAIKYALRFNLTTRKF